jgi:hypothetical protein
MAEETTYKADNYWYAGLIGTVLFHGLLLLFLIFYIFRTPIPPLEPGGGGPGLGIEVNLGSSDFGIGSEQIADLTVPDFVNEKPVNLFTSESYVTQDNSDAENISSVTKTDNTTKTDNNTKTTINDKALYKKNTNGQNQGVTGGTGNQGNVNGNLTSTNYLGDGGDGNGGGTGGGVGTGDGPGNGPGTGPGISYDIKGRKLKNLSKPIYTADDEGKIVVTVTVDKNGKVTAAKAGAKGTTIANSTLRKQCEAAALKSTFEYKSDAPVEQSGTITYIFLNLN